MKISLVNINREIFSQHVAPLGLCFIASYLKQNGGFNNLSIIDQNTENILKAVQTNKPDIVGISSVSQNHEEAKEFADFVKQQLHIPVIIGGVHISISPTSLTDQLDVGVMGEGEESMLELMQLYEREREFNPRSLSQIKGICYKQDGKLRINPPRPALSPEKITHPDRSLLNMKHYLSEINIVPGQVGRSLHMMTSRGCPYKCVFCSTSSFWQNYRELSTEWVMDEINTIISDYQANVIHIFDDLFLANRKRFFEIADRVKKERINEKVKFMCLGRANLLDDAIMVALKDMNVACIGFGMESGSDKVLKYLKANTVNVAQNRKAVEYCKKYKIIAMGSFMIGNPNETEDDLKQTLSFIEENKYNPYFEAPVYITTPLPATKIWEEAKKKGIVGENINWDNLCMDLPSEINQLKNAPLLTELSVEKFFEYTQKFKKQASDRQTTFFYKNNKVFSKKFIKKAILKPHKTLEFSVQILKGAALNAFTSLESKYSNDEVILESK